MFLPEEGEVWAGCDASQQEFRIAVHYAAMHNVPKTNIALDRYRADPDTDFHAFAAQLTGLERKHAKNVNFAKIYGAGVRKFAAMIGKPESEAKAIYDSIRSRAAVPARAQPALSSRSPPVRATSRSTMARAGISISGRRAAPGRRVPDHVNARKPSAGSPIQIIHGLAEAHFTAPISATR